MSLYLFKMLILVGAFISKTMCLLYYFIIVFKQVHQKISLPGRTSLVLISVSNSVAKLFTGLIETVSCNYLAEFRQTCSMKFYLECLCLMYKPLFSNLTFSAQLFSPSSSYGTGQ